MLFNSRPPLTLHSYGLPLLVQVPYTISVSRGRMDTDAPNLD
jgi:hypothetical protein